MPEIQNFSDASALLAAIFFGAFAAILSIASIYNAVAPNLPYPLSKVAFHAMLISISAVISVVCWQSL